MSNTLAHILAKASRTAPFERGRWRLGNMAYNRLKPAHEVGRQLVNTRHGFSLSLDLRQFIDRTIYCVGEWEPHETEVVKSVLKPGDTFVDVGANIGYFTLLASKLVGESGMVHAIEANPETFGLLTENIARNGALNVEANSVAAGEQAGEAIMHSREAGNAGADFAVSATDTDNHGGERVALVRLDALLESQPIRLIKLDIEGGEAAALRGAENLLARTDAPDILFELTPTLLQENGEDAEALTSWLGRLGYTLKEVSAHHSAERPGYEQRNIHAFKL